MAKPVTHERARAARGSRRRRWCLGEALGPALGARGPGCGRGRAGLATGWARSGGEGHEAEAEREQTPGHARGCRTGAAGP